MKDPKQLPFRQLTPASVKTLATGVLVHEERSAVVCPCTVELSHVRVKQSTPNTEVLVEHGVVSDNARLLDCYSSTLPLTEQDGGEAFRFDRLQTIGG
jgi:hypothetical protein